MQTKRVRVAVLAGLLAVLFHIHLTASPGGTLLDAIRRDDAAAVRVLIRSNTDVNASDAGGATALMHAALLSGPQVVRHLLDGGAGVNTANRFGATALMWAVSRPENVQLLLQRGANVNARASNGWSALVAATRHGQLASMRMLLAAGADIVSPEARRQVLTASFQASSPEVRRLLREAGLVVGSRADVAGPVLMRARDDMPSFRHLLDLGVDPKESLQTFTIALPIFFLAARNGQLEAMRALVEKGMDPRFVGARGTTALTLAAGADRPSHEVIRFLLDHGADMNATDADGRTALDWALTRGETDTSAFLRGLGGRTSAVPAPAPAAITSPLKPHEAIARALARLQPAGRAFTDKTKCTSCHNEYIPGIAVALARRRGITVDESLAAHSMSVTEDNWQRRREPTLLGETLGGDRSSAGPCLRPARTQRGWPRPVAADRRDGDRAGESPVRRRKLGLRRSDSPAAQWQRGRRHGTGGSGVGRIRPSGAPCGPATARGAGTVIPAVRGATGHAGSDIQAAGAHLGTSASSRRWFASSRC